MKYIISRYNHDLDLLEGYKGTYVMYDRSEEPIKDSRVIITDNTGSDIRDKLTFIIDNYENLPEVALYTKCNLFKYITKEEWEEIKNNKTFTPVLTKHHKTYSDNNGVVCFYDENGMYNERNDYWYLLEHPTKTRNSCEELKKMLGLEGRDYLAFAPGSNYILPKENILKHSKEFYQKLRSYLDWAVYPGEAQLCERGLYYLWQ